jgi:TPR repeat protein
MAMRFVGIVLALTLGAATAADAVQDKNGGFPDIATQYFHRADCHEAYDLVAEQVKGGQTVSNDDKVWAGLYEAAAQAGQPCPEPGPSLALRATDRTVSTPEGLDHLALYHKQDDPVAWFEAALSVLQGKVPEVEAPVGWAMLVKSAQLGYAPAQYFEALLYINGTATGKADYASALPLLESAAKAGHVDALFLAGNYYYDGSLGVKKDSAKAFTYFTQAAERGHVYATYMAANMANDGAGVKTDHALAYRLARNLADQGEVIGSVIAASALLQMKDAKDREDEVLYWMDTAIRDGDDKIRGQVSEMRPRVVAAFNRANAPPEYHPRVWKACPMKTTCLVDTISGRRECTTNKDYWNDCDG